MNRYIYLVAIFVINVLMSARAVFGAEPVAPAVPPLTPVTVAANASPEASLAPAVTTSIGPAPSNQPFQNTNNINIAQPVSVPIVSQPAPSQVAYTPQANIPPVSSVLGTVESVPVHRVSISPIFGGVQYVTGWRDHVWNEYSAGLLLEAPLASYLSAEVEGTFGKFKTEYTTPGFFAPYAHLFNQYGATGNVKIYLAKSFFRPYLGGGIGGLYYENMDYGPLSGGSFARYNQWIGTGSAFAGLEIALSEGIAVGARATLVHPLFNRPVTCGNAFVSGPGCEDAGLMNTDFVRVMGTVRISL